MEQSEHQHSEYATKAQENNVNQDNELAMSNVYCQAQQELMAQQAREYYEYLVRQDQLLQQYCLWQLQLQEEQQAANRYSSLTSFLRSQSNSFLTPWSRNHNDDGDYMWGVGVKECMMFEPGSFFTNNVPYVKPESTQESPSQHKHTDTV